MPAREVWVEAGPALVMSWGTEEPLVVPWQVGFQAACVSALTWNFPELPFLREKQVPSCCSTL